MKDSVLTEWIALVSMRINARIDDQADVAQAFFRNWKVKVEETDHIGLVSQVLKRKGYSKYGNLFTKGFVCFEIEKATIKVWVDIPRIQTKKQIITESFVTGVIVAANYYERLC